MKSFIVIAALCLISFDVAAQRSAEKQTPKAKSSSAEHVKTYTPDAVQWSAAPNALPSGAQLAVLEGNPMKPGPYTMRLKMPDGYKIPPHHHARREHVTVVSGSFKVGMGDKFEDDKMSTFAPEASPILSPLFIIMPRPMVKPSSSFTVPALGRLCTSTRRTIHEKRSGKTSRVQHVRSTSTRDGEWGKEPAFEVPCPTPVLSNLPAA